MSPRRQQVLLLLLALDCVITLSHLRLVDSVDAVSLAYSTSAQLSARVPSSQVTPSYPDSLIFYPSCPQSDSTGTGNLSTICETYCMREADAMVSFANFWSSIGRSLAATPGVYISEASLSFSVRQGSDGFFDIAGCDVDEAALITASYDSVGPKCGDNYVARTSDLSVDASDSSPVTVMLELDLGESSYFVDRIDREDDIVLLLGYPYQIGCPGDADVGDAFDFALRLDEDPPWLHLQYGWCGDSDFNSVFEQCDASDVSDVCASHCGSTCKLLDSDNDEVVDCADGCPFDPSKTVAGICGCGKADNDDSDSDGSVDCLDQCPNDPLKAADGGVCGCDVDDKDEDGNTVIDCAETPTMGDTLLIYAAVRPVEPASFDALALVADLCDTTGVYPTLAEVHTLSTCDACAAYYADADAARRGVSTSTTSSGEEAAAVWYDLKISAFAAEVGLSVAEVVALFLAVSPETLSVTFGVIDIGDSPLGFADTSGGQSSSGGGGGGGGGGAALVGLGGMLALLALSACVVGSVIFARRRKARIALGGDSMNMPIELQSRESRNDPIYVQNVARQRGPTDFDAKRDAFDYDADERSSMAGGDSGVVDNNRVLRPRKATVRAIGDKKRYTQVMHRINQHDWVIRFDSLTIGEELGRGAYGVVHLGRWRATDVAIKQVLDNNDISAAEFACEIETLSQIRPHSNVLRFYGACVDHEAPLCIVTEYMAGGSLIDVLRNDEELSLREILGYAAQAAAGISHLHAEGLVHRDIAARNILRDKAGVAKVSDFGMARTANENGRTTKADTGPLKWMSPEQISAKVVSRESDAWSFGCLCVELLTRQEPYANLDPMSAAIGTSTGELTPVVPDWVPSRISVLVNRMFAFEPDERPSFDAIERELTSILATLQE